MSYRLILFDFDGTLADSLPWFLATVNKVAAELNFRRIEPEEVEGLRRMGARQLTKHLRVPWWKIPRIARRMRALMAEDVATVRTFPGVADMIRRLSDGGLILAIVTSNAEENVRRILGPETAALLKHWECGTSLFGKARRFKQLLRTCRVPAREALCIGDELRDEEAARQVGIDFAGVSWGFTERAVLADCRPALLFDRVEEIAERLLPRAT